MERHNWRGHTIDVFHRVDPRKLWLVGGFYVSVDGGPEFQPSREFGRPTIFEFLHDGKRVTGLVHYAKLVRASAAQYEVEIDGERVTKGCVRAENYASAIAGAICVGLILSLLLLALTFAFLVALELARRML